MVHDEVRDAAALEHPFRLVELPVDAEVDTALTVLFGGLTEDEIADVLEVSPITVKRDYKDIPVSVFFDLLMFRQYPRVDLASYMTWSAPSCLTNYGGATPVGGSPEKVGAFLRSEFEKWRTVVRESGAVVD